jgi:hypothetical protein
MVKVIVCSSDFRGLQFSFVLMSYGLQLVQLM